MFFKNLSAVALALVFGLGGVHGTAQAASTEFPPFNQNQHVYVAPSLKNKPGYDVDVATLEGNLVRVASQQNLAVYEVFTLQGDEPTGGSIPFGPARAKDLVKQWRNEFGFPTQNFLVVVCVRAKSDPNKWQVGVEAGDKVSRYISGTEIGTIVQNNFPTLKAGDPKKFSLTVVDNICHTIGKHAAVNPPVTPPVTHPPVVTSPSDGVNVGLLLCMVVGGSFVLLAVIRAVVYKSRKNALAAAEKAFAPAVNNAGACVREVQESNHGKLLDKSWSFNEGSVSATNLANARQLWSLFLTDFKAASQRLDEANKASAKAKGWLLYSEPLAAATRLLTTVEVEVSRKVLDAAELDLFGGLLGEPETVLPPALAQRMNQRFTTANQTLSTLWDSIGNSQGNADTIRRLRTDIADERTKLEAAGLSFAPYQKGYDAIEGNITAFLANVKGDPEGAFAASETEKARVQALKNAVIHAVALKKLAPELSKAVTTVKQSVAELRKLPVKFEFAGQGTRANWTFAEEGGNPDPHFAEADKQLAAFTKALNEGRLTDADSAKDAMFVAIGEGQACIKAVQNAKQLVDKDGPALKGDPNRSGLSNGIEVVSNAYTAQNFLFAAETLATVKVLDALHIASVTVGQSCHANSQVTSNATDAAVQKATAQAGRVYELSGRQNVDWKQVAAEAAAAASAVAAAKTAVDSDVQAHANAVAKVNELQSELSSGATVIDDRRVGQQAQSKFAAARSEFETCQRSLKGRKADWKAITTRASNGINTVAEAVRIANNDIAEDERCRQAIAEAELELRSYGGRTYVRVIRGVPYGAGISCNTASAYHHQMAAERYYRDRQYDLMRRELELMRQEAFYANTLAWWMCFQMMHASSDPWARQYAYDQGFRDGVAYDSWRDSHVSHHSDSSQDWQPTPESDWHPTPEHGSGGSGTVFDGGYNGHNDSEWEPIGHGGGGDVFENDSSNDDVSFGGGGDDSVDTDNSVGGGGDEF